LNGIVSRTVQRTLRHPLGPITVLALIGFTAIPAFTKYGVGLDSDSVTYICTAYNIQQGNGFSISLYNHLGEMVPMTLFPPGYPLLLTLLGLTGFKLLGVIRLLNTVLFGGNIFLLGFIAYKLTGRKLLGAWVSLLTLISIPTIYIHVMAWTEPVFVFIGLIGFLLLAEYIRRGNTLFLLGSGALVGAALLTRYVAIALLVTALITLGLSYGIPRRKRILAAGIFSLLSVTPVVFWSLRNAFCGGIVSHRQVSFYPQPLVDLTRPFAAVPLSWGLPPGTPLIIKTFIFLILILSFLYLVGIAIGRVKRLNGKVALGANVNFIVAPAVFFFAYIGVLVTTKYFFDPVIYLDTRLLSPLFIAGLLFAAVILNRSLYVKKLNNTITIIGVSLISLTSLGLVVGGSSFFTRVCAGEDVNGYASRRWKESRAIAEINEMRDVTVVYSNAPDAIYALTGKKTRFLPYKLIAGVTPNPMYARELEEVREELISGNGILIYFNTVPWRDYLPGEEELVTKLDLRRIVKTSDASIYRPVRAPRGNRYYENLPNRRTVSTRWRHREDGATTGRYPPGEGPRFLDSKKRVPRATYDIVYKKVHLSRQGEEVELSTSGKGKSFVLVGFFRSFG